MKKITIALAAVACVVTPAGAKPPQEAVSLTTPAPHLDEWVEIASQNITKSLERIRPHDYRAGRGVTYVQFVCDKNGKPTNIRTIKSSNNDGLDMLGRIAISKVNSLYPLFKGVKSSQLFEVAIISENDERKIQKLTKMVSQRAHSRNAYFAARGVPNAVVTMAVVRKS